MVLEVDVESGVPIYMQIVERIKMMVASGQLEPGQQLPTIRQMAADLRINFNTVGRAYTILDQEGVISTQQGRGTYIATRLSDGQMQELHLDKLRSMIGHALQEAVVLGYSRSEIRDVFEEALKKAAPADE
jgi:GntR family transcriptional regulator